MNRRKSVTVETVGARLRCLVGATVTLAVLAVLPAGLVRTAPVPILEPVESAALTGSALSSPAPGTARSRAVRVNLHALPTPGTNARTFEDDLELELFSDLTVRAVFDRFETVAGSGTWVGRLDGIPLSSATLAYREGLLFANINIHGAIYQVRPATGASESTADRPLHIVSEIDPSRLPKEAEPLVPPVEVESATAARADVGADGSDIIDLMMVYTPSAADRAGGPAGIQSLIALAVSDANAAYADSGIAHRLRLVHSVLVPYAEPNPNPLRRSLEDITNGRLPVDIRRLRDERGADLVAMLVGNTTPLDACGMAWIAGQPTQSAFGYSVTHTNCISINTFPHEIGHNMGAAHDWFDGARSVYPFGYGHVDAVQRWRTIMSYDDICVASGFSCGRLRYFSNPQIEYVPFCSGTSFNCDLLRAWLYPRGVIGSPSGSGTGCRAGVVPASPCEADNRRLHNTTAPFVANYRQAR